MILVVDGTNVAHRALAAPSDDPPEVVFGRIVSSAARRHQVTEVVTCWDTPGFTWRHRLYPLYKKGAKAGFHPVDFLVQKVIQIALQEGWQILRAPGYEADDLVAYAVSRSETAWVLSSDRDVWQLVKDNCLVIAHRDMRRLIIDPAWVEAEVGVPPSQYVDVAALRGDTSDNLPNVPGIGPFWAAKLVRRFGSVFGIYDNLGYLRPEMANALSAHYEQVVLNLALSRLEPPTRELVDATEPKYAPLTRA